MNYVYIPLSQYDQEFIDCPYLVWGYIETSLSSTDLLILWLAAYSHDRNQLTRYHLVNWLWKDHMHTYLADCGKVTKY